MAINTQFQKYNGGINMKKKKLYEEIFENFEKRMKERGFKTAFLYDKFMPRVICGKQNHYRFSMIAFLNPIDKPVSISLQATIGTDVRTVMYFKMEDIDNNTWDRFDAMMNAAEEYINYELPYNKEDRREF